MAESKEFKAWHRLTTARIVSKLRGEPTTEERVEKAMDPKNLRVEVKDETGRWVSEEPA